MAEAGKSYDAALLVELLARLQRHTVNPDEAAGMAGMLCPIDSLAENAAVGMTFDSAPADFLRELCLQSRARDIE